MKYLFDLLMFSIGLFLAAQAFAEETTIFQLNSSLGWTTTAPATSSCEDILAKLGKAQEIQGELRSADKEAGERKMNALIFNNQAFDKKFGHCLLHRGKFLHDFINGLSTAEKEAVKCSIIGPASRAIQVEIPTRNELKGPPYIFKGKAVCNSPLTWEQLELEKQTILRGKIACVQFPNRDDQMSLQSGLCAAQLDLTEADELKTYHELDASFVRSSIFYDCVERTRNGKPSYVVNVKSASTSDVTINTYTFKSETVISLLKNDKCAGQERSELKSRSAPKVKQ